MDDRSADWQRGSLIDGAVSCCGGLLDIPSFKNGVDSVCVQHIV